MNRVHKPEEKPLDQMGPVAVAIGPSDTDMRHIGILHRDAESNQAMMLHLEWHLRLANGPPIPAFHWVDPGAHPRRLVQVAAICRLVWKANQAGGIPYGFSPPNDCIDSETGKYLIGPTRLGLTCATFVLAVFHRAGLQLVNYTTWPVGREGDQEWQEKIVTLLERKRGTTEHMEAVRKEIGSARFRPEEVAGAATEAHLPVEFELACQLGLAILDRLYPRTEKDRPKPP